MSKITAYSALTGPAAADVLPVVDTSDATMAATGTTKKMTLADLLTAAQGLTLMTGSGTPGSAGGTVTAATIASAIAAGSPGLYLDPRYVWDLSGLVIGSATFPSGISNFRIKSNMGGSAGWTGGVLYNTGGYCTTGTGTHADGIQIYGDAGAENQGLTLEGLAIVGPNSNGVVHLGGRQRALKLIDCLLYNTNSVATTVAAGSNGVNVSTFAGAGTLNVASASGAGYATSGNAFAATSTGCALISYTGTTGTTLTGCRTLAGTGTLATGGAVWQAAFGLVVDTALKDFNSEQQSLRGTQVAGVNCAVGWGVNDQTQHHNDSSYYDLVTACASGPVSVAAIAGSNLQLHAAYDRSPSTGATVATYWNPGGILNFWGGEDQNNSSTGLAHLVAGGVTSIRDRLLTVGGSGAATVTVTSGSYIVRGRAVQHGTITLSGSGFGDFSDPAVNLTGTTLTGSGSVALNASYQPGGVPTVSATGGTSYVAATVATKSGVGQTTTQSLTWTPPSANCMFRVKVMVHPTTAGTSTVASITYTERGPTSQSFNIACLKQDGTSTACQYLNASTGTFLGDVTSQTDNSGTNVVVTITPTGSTYRYAISIELLATA